jgi:hypothetical protein
VLPEGLVSCMNFFLERPVAADDLILKNQFMMREKKRSNMKSMNPRQDGKQALHSALL